MVRIVLDALRRAIRFQRRRPAEGTRPDPSVDPQGALFWFLGHRPGPGCPRCRK